MPLPGSGTLVTTTPGGCCCGGSESSGSGSGPSYFYCNDVCPAAASFTVILRRDVSPCGDGTYILPVVEVNPVYGTVYELDGIPAGDDCFPNTAIRLRIECTLVPPFGVPQRYRLQCYLYTYATGPGGYVMGPFAMNASDIFNGSGDPPCPDPIWQGGVEQCGVTDLGTFCLIVYEN